MKTNTKNQGIPQARGRLDALVRRTPPPAWSQDEDDDLKYWYGSANGAFVSYRYMAETLNSRYHGGANIRKPGAVCRRDGHVNYGKPWGRSSNVVFSDCGEKVKPKE